MIDPIDGSLNAKRGIGFFSLSIAVASGATMGDVDFGFVHDFGTEEEWTATRGEGASLNGSRLCGEPPKERIEILAFEATLTSLGGREGGRRRRPRPPPADHGLARPLALPPRRRTRRRRLLAEAGAGRGHRGRPAARPRARPRDRAPRGASVRRRRRSTSRGVHGSSQRERPTYAGSSQPPLGIVTTKTVKLSRPTASSIRTTGSRRAISSPTTSRSGRRSCRTCATVPSR